MPGIDYSAHVTNTASQGPAPATATAKAAADTSSKEDSGFTFSDFLDIINPLQHIPVISTLYRHFAHDKIGVPEKIAGDTLYGGLMGLFASLGDALFQEVTGKDVGDTVYAMVFGNQPATAVASASTSAKPAKVTPANAIIIPPPDIAALTKALQSKHIDSDIAQRAIFAYGRAIDRTVQAY